MTFHNTENGFCVLRVKARGQRGFITVVGHAAMISAGEFLQARGGWVNDRGYWNRRLHKIVYADRISLLEERQ